LKKRGRQADREWRAARLGDDVADRVVDAFTRLSDGPFFVFAHLFDVHYDYDPPERYWRHFDPDYTGEMNGTGFHGNKAFRRGMSDADYEHILALYDGEILYTDEQIGRMLERLESLGLMKRTLVVITADHGEEFLEHGDKGHRKTLFDEQLLIPLVMHHPARLPAGRRVTTPVRLIDVMPTILDFAGIDAPAGLSGRSLLPLIGGEDTSEAPALSYLKPGPRRTITALRTRDAKVIIETDRKGRARAHLYDLRLDPGEQDPAREGPALEASMAALREHWNALQRQRDARPASGEPTPVEISQDMREALESLGYLSDDEARAVSPAPE
jgi:arylsulfatase A-like enzyme